MIRVNPVSMCCLRCPGPDTGRSSFFKAGKTELIIDNHGVHDARPGEQEQLTRDNPIEFFNLSGHPPDVPLQRGLVSQDQAA